MSDDGGAPSSTRRPQHPAGLGELRQTLTPEELGTASLAELLFYGLGDGGEGGAEAILRAARDDLRNFADLATGTHGASGAEFVSPAELGPSLDGIARRLDVVLELHDRAARPPREASS